MPTSTIAQIEKLQKTISTSFLNMGKLLLKVQKTNNFAPYSSFEEVVENAACLTMGKATQYMTLYTIFVETYNQDIERLAKIGIGKLKAIAPAVSNLKQCEHWLGLAETADLATLKASLTKGKRDGVVVVKFSLGEEYYPDMIKVIEFYGGEKHNTVFDALTKRSAFEKIISDLMRINKLHLKKVA